jgi:hypothetical protein
VRSWQRVDGVERGRPAGEPPVGLDFLAVQFQPFSHEPKRSIGYEMSSMRPPRWVRFQLNLRGFDG